MVRYPLYPGRDMSILPPVPGTSIHDGFTYNDCEILSNNVDHALSFFCLALSSKWCQQTVVDVYVLQDDLWAICSSAVSEIPGISLLAPSLNGDGKIYNLVSMGKIDNLFVLDLASSSLSLLELPEEVVTMNVGLSLADDSGVHLTHVTDFKIRIWLHRMDSNGVTNWFLVNTICLREICGNHMIPIHMFEDVDDYFLEVHAVGFNYEFVFIEIGNVLYLFDIKRKAAKKVYELTQEDRYLSIVSPFVMVWPPKFPAMKEGCDRSNGQQVR